MQTGTLFAAVLTTTLLIGGCVGPSSPATPADGSPTSTATPSSTPATTPTTVASIPSPSECLTDATPRPESVDGVEPSAYPEPPTDVTRDSLVGWTQAFETAYFRNTMVAEEPGDDNQNLTEASAFAEARAVNHTAQGYILRFSNSGATNYASGAHGDVWMDVGYVVNETHVVRVPLTDREDPVRASAGTVVVSCQ